jgi:twitching motility protein PilT
VNIEELLRYAVDRKASDLHLKVGNFPHLRVDGELRAMDSLPKLSQEDVLDMAFSMMSNRQKAKFKETSEMDLAFGISGLGRFRVNVFQQRGNVGLVLRVVPTKIRSLEELNLPPVISSICDERRGMVLVTGTTGSGKSTTLASMIDRINSTRSDHIITVEDPIEYLHHRIPASRQEGLCQPTRSGSGYQQLLGSLARRSAPRPRLDSRRRNARPGNHQHRVAGG